MANGASTMKQTARLRYLRMTPRKVRLVADLLRGRPANVAEAELMLIRKRAAVPLLKLLRSAVAGAKNRKMASEKLVVERIQVDQGPMLKRYLPRARGMATPIQKKMSHVTIVLSEKEGVAAKFTVVPKAKKVPHGDHGPKKSAPKEKGQAEAGPKTAAGKEKGFFRQMFRRKSV